MELRRKYGNKKNMKIIITENQYKLLLEETEGLDNFLETLKNNFDLSEELIDEIKLIFEKADCKKVSFEQLNSPMGLALHNKLVLNTRILNIGLIQSLFIIFHELAHQYQFKKYGADKMIGIYIDDIDINDAAIDMSKYEAVADEFAMRKVRELQQKGLLNKNQTPIKGYGNNPPPSRFKTMLEMIRTQLKRSGVDNIDDAAEYIYNMVKPR